MSASSASIPAPPGTDSIRFLGSLHAVGPARNEGFVGAVATGHAARRIGTVNDPHQGFYSAIVKNGADVAVSYGYGRSMFTTDAASFEASSARLTTISKRTPFNNGTYGMVQLRIFP